MTPYVLLLRGVNVGGNNILPMKELKACLEQQGYDGVKTYIQSGNIVIKSATKPDQAVEELIEKYFGFKPNMLVLSATEFEGIAANNPYTGVDGKTVHFYFCREKPNLNQDKITQFIGETEKYTLIDQVLYLYAPDGIGRSKLVTNIEKCLGTVSTGRNLNTVIKLQGMINQ